MTTPLDSSDTTTTTPGLLRPHRPYDYVRVGFFTSMGVALLGLLALVVWKLSGAALSIITPFVLGTAFALLLDPVVDRLGKHRIGRGMAVFIVFSIFVLILVAIGIYGVPALINQVTDFAAKGPTYLESFRKTVNNFLTTHHKILGYPLPKNADALLSSLTGQGTTTLTGTTGKVKDFLLGSVSTLFDAIITLIITFYLLLDIDRIRARMYYLAPARVRAPMSQYARDIGSVFTEYLRGLLIVSTLYGIATMVALACLSLLHRELFAYVLLIGVAGGILYAVPYVGPLVTAAVTFLVAFSAGGLTFGIIAIVVTLIVNQIFDNVITPRVVGGGVGLSPVASLFALTLGGTLFGLWGLLLSVPVAASIQAILFRLFPKLTTPTPAAFLRAQGVSLDDAESPKMMQGDTPRPHDVSPETTLTKTTDALPDTAETADIAKTADDAPPKIRTMETPQENTLRRS